MRMHLVVGTVLVGFLMTGEAAAQEDWGKVSQDVLDMEMLPEDPEADAVILFDQATVAITLQFRLVVQRHRRVKIFTDRGLDQADVAIFFNEGDRIRDLKAQTILPNGKKVKLRKKDIFEERYRGMKRKVFTLPAVGPGVVAEYSYGLQSKYLHFLVPWYFQNRVFTRLSRLTLILPDGFNFQAFYSNFPLEDPEPEKEITSMLRPGIGQVYVAQFVWEQENLPGVRSEPHMTNVRDYLASVRFQLASFKNDFADYSFIQTWDDVAETLRDGYRKLLKPGRATSGLVSRLVTGTGDDRAKARALFDHVQRDLQTVPHTWVMGNDVRSPREVIEDGSASGIEKNLLLTCLLRQAGLDAHPCLISTRSNGRLDERQPAIQQFDFVLACLDLGEDTLLLDARDEHYPFGLLPPADLNGKGLVVAEKGHRMVDIPVPSSFRQATTSARLDPGGDLQCRTTLSFERYDAVQRRNELSEKTGVEFVRDLLGDRFGQVTVDSFAVHGASTHDAPLSVGVSFRVHGYAQATGDMMYFSPGLFHILRSNPFQREDRQFPVDFPWGSTSMEEVAISLPNGFRIVEGPRPTVARMEGLRFVSACQLDGRVLRYQRRYQRKDVHFPVRQYRRLRETHARIIVADQGQVALTSRPEPAPTDG